MPQLDDTWVNRQMKINDVLFVTGRSSFLHQDRDAIRGGAKPNGYLYDGDPVTPGFDRITQPAQIVSIMLLLDDDIVALGDCVDVILAGHAGRDRPFIASEHIGILKESIAPRLIGREIGSFKEMAQEFDTLQVEGARLHTAVRYGVTQALLDAVAQSRREQLVEVVAREYDQRIIPIEVQVLAACLRDNYSLHDRMILKRADLLPHSSFGEIDVHIGRDGQIFLDYVKRFRDRILEIGEPDYHPRLHFDVYGSIGELFEEDVERTADYLAKCADLVAPFDLLIESPFVLGNMHDQIEIFGELRVALARKGAKVTIIADEWCNTLEDIKRWADANTADMVQIKAPDLGGINNTIEAVVYCNGVGMGNYLGGSINETIQSAKVTAHIGMATRPAFLFAKPGLGGDESYAFLKNEMSRTHALLEHRRSPLLTSA